MTNRKEAEQMNEIETTVNALVKSKAIGKDDRLVATVLIGALNAGAERAKIAEVTGLSSARIAPVFKKFTDAGIFVDGKVATEFVGHDGASDEDVSVEFALLVCVGQGYVTRK